MNKLCPKIGRDYDICSKPKGHNGRHDFGGKNISKPVNKAPA